MLAAKVTNATAPDAIANPALAVPMAASPVVPTASATGLSTTTEFGSTMIASVPADVRQQTFSAHHDRVFAAGHHLSDDRRARNFARDQQAAGSLRVGEQQRFLL